MGRRARQQRRLVEEGCEAMKDQEGLSIIDCFYESQQPSSRGSCDRAVDVATRPLARFRKRPAVPISFSAMSILFVMATATIAHAQTLGKDLCACTPAAYLFQINASSPCDAKNIQIGKGITDINCVTNPPFKGNPSDLVFTSVSFLELDQNLQLLTQHNTNKNLRNGDMVEFASYTSNPGKVTTTSVPSSIEIALMAQDLSGTKYLTDWIVYFSNSCTDYPVFQVGNTIGWTLFANLQPAPGRLCPLARQPTSFPSASKPSMSMVPSNLNGRPSLAPIGSRGKNSTLSPNGSRGKNSTKVPTLPVKPVLPPSMRPTTYCIPTGSKGLKGSTSKDHNIFNTYCPPLSKLSKAGPGGKGSKGTKSKSKGGSKGTAIERVPTLPPAKAPSAYTPTTKAPSPSASHKPGSRAAGGGTVSPTSNTGGTSNSSTMGPLQKALLTIPPNQTSSIIPTAPVSSSTGGNMPPFSSTGGGTMAPNGTGVGKAEFVGGSPTAGTANSTAKSTTSILSGVAIGGSLVLLLGIGLGVRYRRQKQHQQVSGDDDIDNHGKQEVASHCDSRTINMTESMSTAAAHQQQPYHHHSSPYLVECPSGMRSSISIYPSQDDLSVQLVPPRSSEP